MFSVKRYSFWCEYSILQGFSSTYLSASVSPTRTKHREWHCFSYHVRWVTVWALMLKKELCIWVHCGVSHLAAVSNPGLKGHMNPRITKNGNQHKTINLLKTLGSWLVGWLVCNSVLKFPDVNFVDDMSRCWPLKWPWSQLLSLVVKVPSISDTFHKVLSHPKQSHWQTSWARTGAALGTAASQILAHVILRTQRTDIMQSWNTEGLGSQSIAPGQELKINWLHSCLQQLWGTAFEEMRGRRPRGRCQLRHRLTQMSMAALLIVAKKLEITKCLHQEAGVDSGTSIHWNAAQYYKGRGGCNVDRSAVCRTAWRWSDTEDPILSGIIRRKDRNVLQWQQAEARRRDLLQRETHRLWGWLKWATCSL